MTTTTVEDAVSSRLARLVDFFQGCMGIGVPGERNVNMVVLKGVTQLEIIRKG
jgi:hypothetical protein